MGASSCLVSWSSPGRYLFSQAKAWLLFSGTGEELHVREIERRSGLNDSTIRQELHKRVSQEGLEAALDFAARQFEGEEIRVFEDRP